MIKRLCIYGFMIFPLASSAMDGVVAEIPLKYKMDELEIAGTHLKNKKEALARAYEEYAKPLDEQNAQYYLNSKHNKAVQVAQKYRQDCLEAATVCAVLGTGFLIPTLWPQQDSGIRGFGGFFSIVFYSLSGLEAYSYHKCKVPQREDIVNKIQAKLNRPYDGKKILIKRMRKDGWYLQPQAAHNPHGKN